MNVLSIHSSVARGHVGNSGVAFTLQRLGHEVWPIDTVVLSNHPAHGGFRGRVTPPEEIAELACGLGERGAFAVCDAVLTGYLGAAAQISPVLDAVAAARRANPTALWLLDPVIGDNGRAYVQPGIGEALRDRAIAEADIVTPNGFELSFLSGQAVDTTEQALAAIAALRAAGSRPKLVVATGLRLRDAPTGVLCTLAVDHGSAWRVATPEIAHPAHGAGDVFSAVLLARLLSGAATPDAVAHAASAVHGVVARGGADDLDLALVAAQAELVSPQRFFAPERLP